MNRKKKKKKKKGKTYTFRTTRTPTYLQRICNVFSAYKLRTAVYLLLLYCRSIHQLDLEKKLTKNTNLPRNSVRKQASLTTNIERTNKT